MSKRISYGERGRIGLIYPSTGWVMEPEFHEMAPEGVSTVTTRIKLGAVTVENVAGLAEHVSHAADLLADAHAHLVVLGCTSGSFVCGPRYDQEIIQRIRETAHCPATTTATAVVSAINAFGAGKVAVGTPYVEEINQCAIRFLEGHGKTVTRLHGLGLLRDSDINSLSREEICDLIRRADTPEAEMVVLLCTSIKGSDILPQMEAELGKPVITAIQATFWECLRLLEIPPDLPRMLQFGSLFSRS